MVQRWCRSQAFAGWLMSAVCNIRDKAFGFSILQTQHMRAHGDHTPQTLEVLKIFKITSKYHHYVGKRSVPHLMNGVLLT